MAQGEPTTTVDCVNCHGKGTLPGGLQTCDMCGGHGTVTVIT